MAKVELSATLHPSARMTMGSTYEAPTPDGKDSEYKVSSGLSMMLKVATMAHEERMEILSAGADDEILILFALLSPMERRGIIRAAETELKQMITKV